MTGFAGDVLVLPDQGKSGGVMAERTVSANFFPVINIVAVGTGKTDRSMGCILSHSRHCKKQNHENWDSNLKPELHIETFMVHPNNVYLKNKCIE